jgi:methionyl-tRNA formyltransferase
MAGKIYNFHPGILPNNKGRFPIFWAILKGESQGVTCHEIGDKVDSGEILFQYALEMQSGTMETILCAYIRSFPILLQQAIVHMEQKRSPQISKGIPSYYGSTPSVKDIKQYRRIVKN